MRLLAIWTTSLGVAMTFASCLRADDEPGTQRTAATAASKPEAPNTQSPERSVEDLLHRLDELERRLSGNPAAEARHASGLAMLLDESHLANTNNYAADAIRYFLCKATLINLTDADIVVPSESIVLKADGREHRISEVADVLRNGPVRFGNQMQPIQIVDQITIPAHSATTASLIYSGLELGPHIPKMTLSCPVGAGMLTLDVNRYYAGVLGMSIERLGPAQCLALVQIAGELNSINVGTLADELDALALAGARRVVLAWLDGAPPPADFLDGWLKSAMATRRSMQFSHLPDISASIEELHLAGLPGSADTGRNAGGVTLHASADEAVIAGLETVVEALSRESIRREIADGHRLSRAAALTHAARRLDDADLPTVLALTDDPDATIQRAAYSALREFPQPASIDALLAVVRQPAHLQRDVALDSLAASRFPAAHIALQGYLESVDQDLELSTIRVLARHPRPEWTDVLYKHAYHDDRELRLAAVDALVRVGHPQLFAILADMLTSDDQQIRDIAFARLVERDDPESEALASAYTLEHLEKSPPTPSMLDLLNRTRDPRALSLLLTQLDRQSENREPLIDSLARVGGPECSEELVSRYPSFTTDEQVATLNAFSELQFPGVGDLARNALGSDEPKLIIAAAKHIGSNPDPDAVRRMAAMLGDVEDANTRLAICNVLSMSGMPEARDALRKARGSDDGTLRAYAINALERMKQYSPAWRFVRQGQNEYDQDNFEVADQYFSLAIDVDAENSDGFRWRGRARVALEKYTEAAADLREAVRLDEYDDEALATLGIALAMGGDFDAALESLNLAGNRFDDNSRYSYNVACVYGRVIEGLSKTEATSERDARLGEYREQAVKHLKTSFEQGFEDVEFMQDDADLASLKGLDAFQELVEEYKDREPKDDDEKKAAGARPARLGIGF